MPAPPTPTAAPHDSGGRGVISDLKALVRLGGFRKLFSVRLVSQFGDGMFQIGLATLFFFSPQNLATAAAVAGAFAILLLPFTIVGPFAGPFLDRWRRRQVLLYGNLTRSVLTIVIAFIMATQGVTIGVYVLALITLGVNRFLLAALSAGLPRVVPPERLLTANSLSPTLGGVSAVFGAALGFLLGIFFPPGAFQDSATLIAAAALFAAASAIALRLGPNQLGPARPESTGLSAAWQQIRRVTGDIAEGARHLITQSTPALALTVMASHRFLYGINFIALLLMSRNLLTDPGAPSQGLAMFGLLSGISFAGNGLAIILTPLAHRWLPPWRWIIICLGIGTLSQALISATHRLTVVAVSAILLGLSVQGVKIAVDTIVQRDTADAYRGRAFTLYDTMYNAAFSAAAVLAAVALPDTGWSAPLFATLTVLYVLLTGWFWRRSSRQAAIRPG